MKTASPFLTALVLLIISSTAVGQRTSSPTGSIEATETIELPPIEVLGERQELALRMIKSALDRGRAYGYEGRNQLYCWYDSPTGSHMQYLYCALNKTMNKSASSASLSFLGAVSGIRSYSHNIFRTRQPVNPLQMERRLTRLGPTVVNDEIVTRAKRGEPMPNNVPSTEEVDRFAAALNEIKAIRSAGKNDPAIEAKMLSVIEENGLTVERYNHISKLVEQYSSLRKMVQERL